MGGAKSALAAAALSPLLLAPALAGTQAAVGYDTFCATAGAQTNGGTQANPWDSWRALVLTDDTAPRTSSVFYAGAVDISAGVAVRAQLDTAQAHDLVPDGFAVVIQGSSQYALGTGGSELGYGGIGGGGIAIEYDFLQDSEWDDPVEDHVAVTWSDADGELSPMTVEGQWLELGWEMQYTHVKEYTALVDVVMDTDAGTFTVNATTTVLTDYVHEPTFESLTLLVTGELADLGDLDLSNVYVGITGASQAALGKLYANYLSVTPAGATECEQDFVEASGGCAVDAELGSCDAITECQQCSASSFCCGWDEASGLCVRADDDDVAETLVFLEQCADYDDADDDADYSGTSSWATVAWVLVGILSATTAFLGYAVSRRPRRKGYSPVVLVA